MMETLIPKAYEDCYAKLADQQLRDSVYFRAIVLPKFRAFVTTVQHTAKTTKEFYKAIGLCGDDQ